METWIQETLFELGEEPDPDDTTPGRRNREEA